MESSEGRAQSENTGAAPLGAMPMVGAPDLDINVTEHFQALQGLGGSKGIGPLSPVPRLHESWTHAFLVDFHVVGDGAAQVVVSEGEHL